MLEKITNTFSNIVRTVSGKSTITEKNIEDTVEQIKMALLEADVNLRVVRRFVNATIEEAKGEKVLRAVDPGQQFVKIIYDRIVKMLGDQKVDLQLKGPDTQSVILLLGLQGAGKTTTCAKIAGQLKKKGKKPLLVACDVYRPAAIKQLEVLGEQTDVPVYRMPPNVDPVHIAQYAIDTAKAYNRDVVILDTAGRLQIDDQLMDELVRIKQAVEVDETLLVVDAMAGQEAVNVAKTFNETVGIDGIILTKTDGDTRGGAALSVLSVTGKPIKFQGTGEKLDDLDVFHPDRMASRILGMGDVLSLIERAQDAADEKAAEETAKRLMENKFDMNDMLEQFAQIRKMGGAGAMLSMLPGASGIDASQIDDKAFDRIEAMIYSMTKEEREKPSIINPKRKRRIAAGSGTRVEDVNKQKSTRLNSSHIQKSRMPSSA